MIDNQPGAADGARQGEILGARYRLERTIAVGGSGTVYAARDKQDDTRVAVKVMHAGHPEGDAERKRFEREADVVRELSHPHVIALLDYGHTKDDVPFLVFPLLEGETLHDRLKRDGAIGFEEAGRLTMQALSALEKAHALGIAHRDIKPANIFLVPTAFGDKVQVLDFGLAKMVTTGGAEVTRSGALVGTPRYMAPEQVRGEQVSEVADIYSMGLVLAEMLSGTPVVSATKEIDIYMAHGSDEPLDLPEVVVRSPVAPIIRRAVAKRLEVRYRQAAQMLVDLRAVLKMMVAGEGHVVAPDLDATFITDPSRVRPRSLPTERSEKLRDAFNRMADKQRIDIPDAAPTLVRPVPEGPLSAPILLTRNADEEIDTLRIAPAPSPPPIELTAADDAGADALAPAAPRNRAATTAVLLVLAFLVAAVIAVYLSAS